MKIFQMLLFFTLGVISTFGFIHMEPEKAKIVIDGVNKYSVIFKDEPVPEIEIPKVVRLEYDGCLKKTEPVKGRKNAIGYCLSVAKFTAETKGFEDKVEDILTVLKSEG